MKALVRRRRGSLRPRRRVRVGELVAEWTATGRLAAVDGRYRLTPAEGTLLEALAERPGCVVPDDVLRQRLSERHGPATAAALRRRCCASVTAWPRPARPAWLQHVPESGWLLAA